MTGLWGFTSPASPLADFKKYAGEKGKSWVDPRVQMQYVLEKGIVQMFLPIADDQTLGQNSMNELQLEPLHRDFLLAIDHVRNVIGDAAFAEKMREDLVELWHEDKVAKGLSLPQALGMTEMEYSRWVEGEDKG